MKKLTLILLSILMIVTLAACGNKCDHAYDNACDATCNECGETREGGAHDFADADCDTAKTCKTCGATEGSALGHEWTTPDVDLCEVQSTCSRCGATDGENKEHAPAEDDGDCSTEVKCTVCGDVTTPAGQHTPNDDDGDCTTAITCTVCGTVTTPAKDSHTDGTATCLGYQCDVCGKWYGDKTPENHASEEFAYTVNEEVYTHRKAHKCCDVTIIEAEAHDFVFETGKCKLCDAQAVAELRNYLESIPFGYYFTMEDAFENIPDDGWPYAVYALTDYDADFTIPVNLIYFFGGYYRSVVIGTVLFNFNGTVINENNIGSGVFNGKVINHDTIMGGIDTIFNGEVINNDIIRGGTFNGEVTNTGSIIEGTFNGCIINNGHISNEQTAGDFTLGENFSIVNHGTIDCKYHIYKDGVCRLCAYECDHSDTAHTTATDNGDGTHGFTCTACGDEATESHTLGADNTCICDVAKLTVEQVSMTNIDSPFGNGWNSEADLKVIGTQAEGKTYWENGDQIIVTFTSPSFGTQYGTLTYDASDGSWSTDASFSYLKGETPTVSAIYAPCYEVVDGNMQLKDGMQLGMTEYISAACSITEGTLNISFEGVTRNYSRLRIVGLANQTLTVKTTGFTPAGATEEATESYKSYTLTTDENGNADLYGTFAERATILVQLDETVLVDYAFYESTASGISYALDALSAQE